MSFIRKRGACVAANLEDPKFIPGRYRRDLSERDVVTDTVTVSSISETSSPAVAAAAGGGL